MVSNLYYDSVKHAMARINILSEPEIINYFQSLLSQLNRLSKDDHEAHEYDVVLSCLNTTITCTEGNNTDEVLEYEINRALDKLLMLNREFKEDDIELLDLTKKETYELSGERFENWLKSNYEGERPDDPKRLNRRRKKIQAALPLYLKLVGGKFGSKRAINFMKQQRHAEQLAQTEWLKNSSIRNNITGEVISLDKVALTTKKRISEMTCRVIGIEKFAESSGMKWARAICTLPPEYHPNPIKGKCSWEGQLPDAGARELQNRWVNTRALLEKYGVKLSGFWTRELHEDSSVHINFMVYFDEKKAKTVESVFKKYFGHLKVQCDFMMGAEVVAGKRGAKFSTYCTKYFKKHFMEEVKESQKICLSPDELKKIEKKIDECLGEETGASNFGYRRYGFIGTPPVGDWRKLRACRSLPEDADDDILRLWYATRNNDYAKYIGLTGGLSVKSSARNFEAYKIENEAQKMVTVGITNKVTGRSQKLKEVDLWVIIATVKELSKNEDNKNQSNTQVTVSLNYPSKSPITPSFDYYKFKNGDYGDPPDPPTIH